MSIPEGKGSREYGSFRESPRGDSKTMQAVSEETRIYPLSQAITASGETVIITGRSDVAIVVKGFHFSKYGGSAVNVSLRDSYNNVDKFFVHLEDDGNSYGRSLAGGWELPVGADLIVNTSGSCQVYVEVETLDDTIGQEFKELSDAITFAEALVCVNEFNLALTDAQSISESIAPVTDFAKGLTDSQTIADSEVLITGDRSKALADSVAITESVGNQTTTELSEADSLSIAESLVITFIPG